MNSDWLQSFYANVDRHAWLILMGACCAEIFWILSLRLADGYTRLWPTLATIPLALLSTGLLVMAMRTIPMGTAYAVWVGIGASGAVLMGIFFFQESADYWRLACIGLIVAGVIGLKLVSRMAG